MVTKGRNRDKRLIPELRLPSRLKFGALTRGMLPVWTESISRHLAVVRLRESTSTAGAIQESDEIALEIDLPERRPFSPRCLHCEGRVGFVTRGLDDSVRLGMLVDRMQFRTTKSGMMNEPLFIARSKPAGSGGGAV